MFALQRHQPRVTLCHQPNLQQLQTCNKNVVFWEVRIELEVFPKSNSKFIQSLIWATPLQCCCFVLWIFWKNYNTFTVVCWVILYSPNKTSVKIRLMTKNIFYSAELRIFSPIKLAIIYLLYEKYVFQIKDKF